MRRVSFQQLINIISFNGLQRNQGVCGINVYWHLTCIDMTEKHVVQFLFFAHLYNT